VLSEKKICRTVADFTGTERIYIGDTGAFYFDNISAEDKLFLLKQTSKSLLFLSETMDIFGRAGSA